MIAIDRYYIYLAIDCTCVVNMGTGVVEKIKEWGENFGYEIWEVEWNSIYGGLEACPNENYNVLEAPG